MNLEKNLKKAVLFLFLSGKEGFKILKKMERPSYSDGRHNKIVFTVTQIRTKQKQKNRLSSQFSQY